MADNLFYTDAKEMVLKIIIKEYPLMPEPLITTLIGYFYKFCHYEEEGLKIRPKVFFTNNLDYVIKNVDNSYKLQIFTDDSCKLFNSRLKSLMSFCKHDWSVYVEVKDDQTYNYGICKLFNSMKDQPLDVVVLENENLIALQDKFFFINLEALTLYAIGIKGLRGSSAVINFSINDTSVINREGVVKRFANACLSKVKTTKKKQGEVRRLLENIFRKAFQDIHGAICAVVDKDYEDKGFFSDGIWLDSPIDLSKVFLQTTKSFSESKMKNISELFIDMLNYDGITIVDNSGKIRAYNVFINTEKYSKKNIAGGGRKRAAYTIINSKLKKVVGVYFQSQDGEIFYEEVIK